MNKENRNVPIFCGAVDIGGTKIASALFTREGEISAVSKIAIDKAGGDAAAAQVAAVIGGLAEAARSAGGRLLAVGLCVPGIAYGGSGKVWAPNIPGWDQYPLRDKIRSDLISHDIPLFGLAQGIASSSPAIRPKRTKRAEGRNAPEAHGGDFGEISVKSLSDEDWTEPTSSKGTPLIIESDRSAYVAGEAWKGAAAGARDAVFLAVGTGIGAGIIADGRIVHGHEDIAGAVGWFGLDPAFKPEYAAMGSFEAEASGNSVARKARERLAQGAPSAMRDLAGGDLAAVTAETVAAAARRGDPLAREVVAGVVTYLGMGIANIVSILNPEVIVLGGGLFQAADLFLEPARLEFRRWAQPLAARSVRIELSTLGENAGLYGCGRLAWDRAGEGKERMGTCTKSTCP